MVAAAVVFAVAGVLSDYPELFALGSAAAVAVLAGCISLLRRPDVDADWHLRSARMTDGGAVRVVLEVRNRNRYRRTGPLYLSHSFGDSARDWTLPGLARQAEVGHEYVLLETTRRGVYAIEPPRIGRTDAMRLVHVARRLGGRSTLYVHPLVHQITLPSAGGPRDLDGRPLSSAMAGGDAFYSLRGYVAGDDSRMIHWGSSARYGELMVRHNVIPEDPLQLVVLDTSKEPYSTTGFEEAVRIAAAVCNAATRAGFQLRLRTTDGSAVDVPAVGGQHLPDTALDLLAGATASSDDTGLASLPVISTVDGPASLMVITGRASAERLAWLGSVRSRFHTVLLIQVTEPSAATRAPDGIAMTAVPDADRFAKAWTGEVIS